MYDCELSDHLIQVEVFWRKNGHIFVLYGFFGNFKLDKKSAETHLLVVINQLKKEKKMKLKPKMDTDTNSLTEKEKSLLKKEIRDAWPEFPKEMKRFIYETKKQKLQSLYMIEAWAKENGHRTIIDLIARRIAHKEAKLTQLKEELGE